MSALFAQFAKKLASLRERVDVYSALVLACKDDTAPDVVERRTKLEASLEEARALLRRWES